MDRVEHTVRAATGRNANIDPGIEEARKHASRDSQESTTLVRKKIKARNETAKSRWKTLFAAKTDDVQSPDPPEQVVRIRSRTAKNKRIIREKTFERFMQMLYRTSFLVVFLWFVFTYFIFVVLNAWIIIMIILSYANRGRECLNGWNYELTGADRVWKNFEIAFDLSWTTYSTVGFGTISPPDMAGCQGLRWYLALEAFTGVLFSGSCGAILYSKISRLNSHAPVLFSGAVCIQFGEGITEPSLLVGDFQNKEKKTTAAEESNSKMSELEKYRSEMRSREQEDEGNGRTPQPYPVLEFKVANEKIQTDGNEILMTHTRCFVIRGEASEEFQSSLANIHSDSNKMSSIREPVRRLDHEIEIQPSFLPFFDAVSNLRHVLDENSMLLKASVRQRIAEIGGWPSNINNAEGIRDALSRSVFEIILTIDGTSNLTADTVFAVHRYKLEDIYIGWRFAGVVSIPDRSELHRETEIIKEKVRSFFDISRIDDIVPQQGGGQETIGDREINNKLWSYMLPGEE